MNICTNSQYRVLYNNFKILRFSINIAKTHGNRQFKSSSSAAFINQRRSYHFQNRINNKKYLSSTLVHNFLQPNPINTSTQVRCFSFSWENLVITQSKIFQSISQSDIVMNTMDALQYIHDTIHLPWWQSIILSTVMLRAVLTLPLAAFQNYIVAKIENLTPKMDEAIKLLKKETNIAVRMFKWDEKHARMMYSRSARKLWKNLIIEENCHPFKATVLVLVQIPLWVTLSISFRNMASMAPNFDTKAQILFMELSTGGFGWLPNLTDVDHSLILPVVMCICNILIVDINTASRIKKGNTRLKFLPYFFKSISIVLLPIAANVPGCLVLYWTTSTVFGLAQNLLLVHPRVRRAFRIPHTPSESETPYQDIKEALQKTYLFKRKK